MRRIRQPRRQKQRPLQQHHFLSMAVIPARHLGSLDRFRWYKWAILVSRFFLPRRLLPQEVQAPVPLPVPGTDIIMVPLSPLVLLVNHPPPYITSPGTLVRTTRPCVLHLPGGQRPRELSTVTAHRGQQAHHIAGHRRDGVGSLECPYHRLLQGPLPQPDRKACVFRQRHLRGLLHTLFLYHRAGGIQS